MKKLSLLLALALLLSLLAGCGGSTTPTAPKPSGYLPELVHPMLSAPFTWETSGWIWPWRSSSPRF